MSDAFFYLGESNVDRSTDIFFSGSVTFDLIEWNFQSRGIVVQYPFFVEKRCFIRVYSRGENFKLEKSHSANMKAFNFISTSFDFILFCIRNWNIFRTSEAFIKIFRRTIYAYSILVIIFFILLKRDERPHHYISN